MQTRRFGWTGVQVPVIGQGTWKMEGDSPAEALAALQAGLDAGHDPRRHRRAVRGGRVESLVARAIAGRRDEVFLVSKVMPNHASRERHGAGVRGEPAAAGDGPPGLLPPALAGAAPAGGHHRRVRAAGAGREDPLLGPEQLRRRRARGGAGHRRAAPHRLQPGPVPPARRDIEAPCPAVVREHEVAVVGYSPFGSGDFPEPKSRGGKVLAEVARAHGVTAHQVALAFLVRDPHVFAIPKSAKVARVRENAAAAGLTADPGRGRAHRRGVPRPEGAGASHALTAAANSLTSHRLNAPTRLASKRRPGFPGDGPGRRLASLSVAALLGLTLAGCASTSLTSYQDPAFATASFGKVAVLATGVQLDERIALEKPAGRGAAQQAGRGGVDAPALPADPSRQRRGDARCAPRESNQVAWVASARTGGSEYAGSEQIVDSFANRTADALEGRQLLAQRAPLQR